MTGKFLPEKEAAARLGVPPSVLRGMINNGEITAVKKGGTMVISVADLDDLVGQKQGRMAGDLAMSEVRSLDEFRENLVRALNDEVVKQALRRCVGGAGFRDQLLEALDDAGVRGDFLDPSRRSYAMNRRQARNLDCRISLPWDPCFSEAFPPGITGSRDVR